MLSPSAARFLSLVLMAAVLPVLGLYALLMKVSTPSPDGGMEPTVTTICYIAFTVLATAMSVVLVNFSRQLAREAKGERQTP
jgi:predicted Co/Zn/Cd cation transporter (cation efflux family)